MVGFSYPVVPQGKARIRTQVSAAHSRQDLELAVAAFEAVRRRISPWGASGRQRHPAGSPPPLFPEA